LFLAHVLHSIISNQPRALRLSFPLCLPFAFAFAFAFPFDVLLDVLFLVRVRLNFNLSTKRIPKFCESRFNTLERFFSMSDGVSKPT
jgi:hypothetical protein